MGNQKAKRPAFIKIRYQKIKSTITILASSQNLMEPWVNISGFSSSIISSSTDGNTSVIKLLVEWRLSTSSHVLQ